MAEENTGVVDEPLTQEQLDAKSAEKYRTQLNGGKSTAQVGDDVDAGGDKPQRPEHIPEKFWDAEKGEVRLEDLAKSYAELEKAKATPPVKQETVDDANLTEEQKAERAEAQKAARETLGLPTADEITSARQVLTDKLVAGQAFEDADYAPFEKLGFDRETIDTMAAGLKALGEVHKAAVHQEAGGSDAYKAMIDWARGEFTPAEVAAYDRDVNSADRAVSLNAVRGLAARYKLASGTSGRDVTNKGGNQNTAEGFKSKAEMVAAMGDKRYKVDEAYRQDVARKVGAARRAGVVLTS
jgi:hypothetical protein